MQIGSLRLDLLVDDGGLRFLRSKNSMDFISSFSNPYSTTVKGSVRSLARGIDGQSLLARAYPALLEHQLSCIGMEWGCLLVELLRKTISLYIDKGHLELSPAPLWGMKNILSLDVGIYSSNKVRVVVNPDFRDAVKAEPAIINILIQGLGWVFPYLGENYGKQLAITLDVAQSLWSKDLPKAGGINFQDWGDADWIIEKAKQIGWALKI
jgi:hypothetical protein